MVATEDKGYRLTSIVDSGDLETCYCSFALSITDIIVISPVPVIPGGAI